MIDASRASRPLPRAPREAPPIALAREYAELLAAPFVGLNETIMKIVRAHLPELVRNAPLPRTDSTRLDATTDEIIRRIIHDVEAQIGQRIRPEQVRELSNRFGNRAALQNKQAISRQFKAVLGVDLPSGDPHLGEQIDQFRAENVRLIKNITDDQSRSVETVLRRTLRTGRRAEDIESEIQGSLGVSESRARLIARDQILKLNGELTQLRHREAGVEEYLWSTSRDERVRGNPLAPDSSGDHFHLEGKKFRWDSPPIVDSKGRRAHPGEDFQCRCVAIPVIVLP